MAIVAPRQRLCQARGGPETEGERRHDDGTKSQFRPLHRGVDEPHALLKPALANWTIRMAFLVVNPGFKRPIWKIDVVASPRWLEAMTPR